MNDNTKFSNLFLDEARWHTDKPIWDRGKTIATTLDEKNQRMITKLQLSKRI
jgi:hypothetical protein